MLYGNGERINSHYKVVEINFYNALGYILLLLLATHCRSVGGISYSAVCLLMLVLI